jgi:hypothetical protein
MKMVSVPSLQANSFTEKLVDNFVEPSFVLEYTFTLAPFMAIPP